MASIIINAQNHGPNYGQYDRFLAMMDGLTGLIEQALDQIYSCDHLQNQDDIIDRIEQMEIAIHSLLNIDPVSAASCSLESFPGDMQRLQRLARRLERMIISSLQDNRMIGSLSIIFEQAVLGDGRSHPDLIRAQSADAA